MCHFYVRSITSYIGSTYGSGCVIDISEMLYICFSYVFILFWLSFNCILGTCYTCWGYLGDVLGMFGRSVRDDYGRFRKCFEIFLGWFWNVFDVFRACVGDGLGICFEWLRDVSGCLGDVPRMFYG